MASYWDIFVAFFRPNIFGYGGGPASIPLLEAEIVDKYQWLTGEEFANVLAVANTLPGPIATKIGGFVGYRIGGVSGALVALFASVGPTVIGMILLYSILMRFSDNPIVAGMIKGVRPVVWTLFLLLVFDYLSFVKSAPAIIIAALAFLLVFVLRAHPAFAIVMGLVAGALVMR